MLHIEPWWPSLSIFKRGRHRYRSSGSCRGGAIIMKLSDTRWRAIHLLVTPVHFSSFKSTPSMGWVRYIPYTPSNANRLARCPSRTVFCVTLHAALVLKLWQNESIHDFPFNPFRYRTNSRYEAGIAHLSSSLFNRSHRSLRHSFTLAFTPPSRTWGTFALFTSLL